MFCSDYSLQVVYTADDEKLENITKLNTAAKDIYLQLNNNSKCINLKYELKTQDQKLVVLKILA